MEMKGKGAGSQGYPPRGLGQRPNSIESDRPTRNLNSRKTDVHYRFLLTAVFVENRAGLSTREFQELGFPQKNGFRTGAILEAAEGNRRESQYSCLHRLRRRSGCFR